MARESARSALPSEGRKYKDQGQKWTRVEGGRGTTIVSAQAMALRVSVVHLVANASFGQHDTLWHNHQLQGFKCNPHKTRKASDGWASRGDFPRGVRAAGAARSSSQRLGAAVAVTRRRRFLGTQPRRSCPPTLVRAREKGGREEKDDLLLPESPADREARPDCASPRCPERQPGA